MYKFRCKRRRLYISQYITENSMTKTKEMTKRCIPNGKTSTQVHCVERLEWKLTVKSSFYKFSLSHLI